MSQANVELVKEIYEALNRKDALALVTKLDSKIEIVQSREMPWGGEFQGLMGAQRFFSSVMSHLDSQVAVDRYLDSGDSVVAIGRSKGRVKSSGASFDVEIVHVWTIRDERIARMQIYIDHGEMQKVL